MMGRVRKFLGGRMSLTFLFESR
ncbi:MAG: hypothetical protein K0Q90_781, partial [Paenibacillaceae bacterium]|nr:hypothetical protein [Paenibacillaceae bacterium]